MEESLASTPTNRVVSCASFFRKQWALRAGKMSLLPLPSPRLVTVLGAQWVPSKCLLPCLTCFRFTLCFPPWEHRSLWDQH